MDAMDAISKAKLEMQRFQSLGNYFGYKQAKRHYEKLLRKERLCNKKTIAN